MADCPAAPLSPPARRGPLSRIWILAALGSLILPCLVDWDTLSSQRHATPRPPRSLRPLRRLGSLPDPNAFEPEPAVQTPGPPQPKTKKEKKEKRAFVPRMATDAMPPPQPTAQAQWRAGSLVPEGFDKMTPGQQAWELWAGKYGALFWMNSVGAWGSMTILFGWVFFRLIGPALGLYELQNQAPPQLPPVLDFAPPPQVVPSIQVAVPNPVSGDAPVVTAGQPSTD